MRRLHSAAQRLLRQLASASSIVILCWVGSAQAAEDPQLEARVMQVAEGLRCLVCQNETIAASQASLAVDLRGQIREQLEHGQTPEQIRNYMVARYGDYVLYRPPWRASTLLLWLGPFVLLVASLAWVVRHLRVRADSTASTLDAAAVARADEWLAPTASHTLDEAGEAAMQGADGRPMKRGGLLR